MTAALILCAALQSPASAFFPVREGMEWRYQEVDGDLKILVRDIVRPRQAPLVKGQPKALSIIETRIGGAKAATSYYDITDEGVFLYGYDAKALLETPRPLLKAADGSRWTYEGPEVLPDGPAALAYRGSAKRMGVGDALDGKAELLRVIIEAEVKTASGKTIKTKSTSIYAEGIGLLESIDEYEVDRRKSRRTRTLLSITGAGGQ
jgi:hypothetical protein